MSTVRIGGSTVAFGVIGHPIAHSLSPVIMNAAFQASGIDAVLIAFDVADGGSRRAVEAVRALGLGGLSVTMPHKAGIIGALDGVSPDAEALGAVNCVVRSGESLIGHNTDGDGLVSAMRRGGVDVSGARCVVFGAGGAARSVIRAIAGAGAASIAVVNRSVERATFAAALAGRVGRVVRPEEVFSTVLDAEIVVNATSVGMHGGSAEGSVVPAEALAPGQVVVDLVYHPLETRLLYDARSAGARPMDGVGMLVGQAAIAFELWTGLAPDVDAMDAAARAALATR